MTSAENARVKDYLRQGPLDYPGRRHENNFITNNEILFDLPEDLDEALQSIDEYLKERDLPLIKDRIPVIAYGANASPGAMTAKFNKYQIEDTPVSKEEMQTVPALKGYIEGSDVVWHGRPSQVGSYFAELYTGEETRDVVTNVVVEFLTPEQLAVLHTTEGETYGVGVTQVKLSPEHSVDAVVYGARAASVLLKNGEPVSVAGVERTGSDREVLTARQVVEYTLGNEAVQDALGGKYSAERYIEEGESLVLKDRKSRQLLVQEALRNEGKSKDMRSPLMDSQNYGRANFISLPRGVESLKAHSNDVELMEQSLARLRPSNDDLERRLAARKALKPDEAASNRRLNVDPIERIRAQATRELLDPARAEALAKLLPNVRL